MIDCNQEKKLFRLKVKEAKSVALATNIQLQTNSIIEQIENFWLFQNSKTFMAYWALYDEVNLETLINKYYKQKTIFLPSIEDNDIAVRVFRGINNMSVSKKFGILEPEGDKYLDLKNIDMIFVPGVAFDKKNNRMGRGKGFYDRFLIKTNALKIGICFDFQLFDNIPNNEFDIKMDYIFTYKSY